jgi:hypothetical protein
VASYDLRLQRWAMRLWARHRLWLRRSAQRSGWAGLRKRELDAALGKLGIPLEEAARVRGVLSSWHPNWVACALGVVGGWIAVWAGWRVSLALAEAGVSHLRWTWGTRAIEHHHWTAEEGNAPALSRYVPRLVAGVGPGHCGSWIIAVDTSRSACSRCTASPVRFRAAPPGSG